MGAGTAAFHTPPAERCRRAGRYNGAVPRDAARMPNPLHDPQPLPQFMAIHAEHVEPAVRELLSANRARIAQLATLSRPTFTTLVEPLEELHHRTSRTWSPVSHLNAVMNSEALRESYNACLPLAFGNTCFPCHQPVKDRDYVFTRYAPSP